MNYVIKMHASGSGLWLEILQKWNKAFILLYEFVFIAINYSMNLKICLYSAVS